MIAKMKKLTFLVYHKEYDAFLKSIRDLGVVHVATKAQGSAENAALQESIRLSARYTAAIKMLQGLNVQPAAAHTGDAELHSSDRNRPMAPAVQALFPQPEAYERLAVSAAVHLLFRQEPLYLCRHPLYEQLQAEHSSLATS